MAGESYMSRVARVPGVLHGFNGMILLLDKMMV